MFNNCISYKEFQEACIVLSNKLQEMIDAHYDVEMCNLLSKTISNKEERISLIKDKSILEGELGFLKHTIDYLYNDFKAGIIHKTPEEDSRDNTYI